MLIGVAVADIRSGGLPGRTDAVCKIRVLGICDPDHTSVGKRLIEALCSYAYSIASNALVYVYTKQRIVDAYYFIVDDCTQDAMQAFLFGLGYVTDDAIGRIGTPVSYNAMQACHLHYVTLF